MAMSNSKALEAFFHEAEDLLLQIEEVALNCDPQDANLDPVNDLFRAFHTIKGSGSMFGLDDIASFTHHVETLLDRIRSGELPLTAETLEVVLLARDYIRDLLADAVHGTPVDQKAGAALEARVLALAAGQTAASQTAAGQTVAQAAPPPQPASRGWRIHFQPEAGMIRRGLSPRSLFTDLSSLGRLTVRCHADQLPELSSLEPDALYLSWTLELESSCSLDEVKDVFIFVEDESDIRIEALEPLAGLPAAASLPALPQSFPTAGPPPPEPGESKNASPDSNSPDNTAERPAPRNSVVRVAADKLDRLVSLVGELVINQSRLSEAANRSQLPELLAPVEEIERLVSELRDSVLGIRMTPIGATFNRFRRLVHDLSGELGKEIDLVTSGAETELDKTVLDSLGDPLVHLIRNSIDHGIETVERRLEQGKPRRGRLCLAATHSGSNVVVSISDDGKGLDAAAIRAKAIERQMIAADATLSEREIFSLIFAPGFSTAKAITNVSGRGVGMDVVKRQIEALRGSIQIDSKPGQGTTISLTLPLTLAIIDGLLVEVEKDQFIIPMSSVTESVELSAAERRANNGRNVFAVRGQLIPYIDLRGSFALHGQAPEMEKIVIVRHQDQRVGLTVDRVIGSHQTVIQNLGRFFRDTHVVSGATITGDGRVALILDIAGLVQFANQNCQPKHSRADLASRLVRPEGGLPFGTPLQ